MSFLVSSYVSPNNGLKGLFIRLAFEERAATAKADTNCEYTRVQLVHKSTVSTREYS